MNEIALLAVLFQAAQTAPPQPAPAGTPDVVHTRDGKKLEGRLSEYSRFVELETPDGKKTRVLRQEVTRVLYAPDVINFPEFVEHPAVANKEEVKFDTRSSRSHLIYIGRRGSNRVIGVDAAKAVKVWEMEVPNRVIEPVIEGPLIYFVQREKSVDESKKIKIRGAPVPRELHKLTVLAVEIDTGKTAWTFSVDNSAASRDSYWDYTPSLPRLDVFPDRVLLSAQKYSYPMDKDGNVDKDKPRKITGLTSWDGEKKRQIASHDTPDTAETLLLPDITNEFAVYLAPVDRSRLKLVGASSKDGKVRWQGEPVMIPSKIVAANEDQTYLSDEKVLTAWTTKTGKKVDKWSIDLSQGMIHHIDYAHVYVHQDKMDPQSLVAIDAKKGTEAWKIVLSKEARQFPVLLYLAHRLAYVDRTNTLVLYDMLAKKEMWRYPGVASDFLKDLRPFGSGISFYRDARVQLLDLETGAKIWEIRSPQDARVIRTIHQVGNAGIMTERTAYTDIIRERKPPAGAAFLTPAGTPLLFALGDGPWSLPAVGKDALYTLSSTGTLAAFKPSDRSPLWSKKISDGAHPALPAPILAGDKLAVQARDEVVLLTLDGQGKTASVRNSLPRWDRPCEAVGPNLVTFTSQGIATLDLAGGKPGWGWSSKNVSAYGMAGDTAWCVSAAGITPVNLKSGEAGASPLPGAADSTWVLPDGKRVILAQGPYSFGVSAAEKDYQPVFKAKNLDPQIARLRFKGSIAVAGGAIYFSSSDGEVACYPASADPKPSWAFKTPQFTSPLLVHGDRLWLAAGGVGLVALDLKTGAAAWKLELHDAGLFTPLLIDGKVAFWSNEGWIVRPEQQ